VTPYLAEPGPRVTKTIFDAGKKLKFVGELEGDRFAGRIDVQAAKEAGVVVVDTTHSSSWPVSEWALALALMGLREHARFRDIIAGKAMSHHDYRTKPPARELTGKSVGMIGFGHIGWRLREFLVPFRNEVLAYDPYAPRELADALDVNFASLEKVMTCDVVICLAPDTAKTRDMIGEKELALLTPGAVFVNVSRGGCVNVPALIAKAEKNDAWFGLDAHNPEPIAVDSPLRQMRNVFLSPHIGGMTVEAQPRFFTLMVEELERWHAGAEPRAQITDRVVAGRSGK
jgi:phosphoglycerate dehydrogenase-like enzyme